MAYDKTNRGTLGKNKRKTEDTHPPYSGMINIEGVEYWLSAFVNVNKETGEKFFGLTAKRKQSQAAASAELKAEFEDDIPF